MSSSLIFVFIDLFFFSDAWMIQLFVNYYFHVLRNRCPGTLFIHNKIQLISILIACFFRWVEIDYPLLVMNEVDLCVDSWLEKVPWIELLADRKHKDEINRERSKLPRGTRVEYNQNPLCNTQKVFARISSENVWRVVDEQTWGIEKMLVFLIV